MSDSVGDKVRAIIAEKAVLDIDDVTPQATLDELGIDSLGLVEAIFAIEETFDITVPFNANDPQDRSFDVSSVGAVIAAVERLLDQKAA